MTNIHSEITPALDGDRPRPQIAFRLLGALAVRVDESPYRQNIAGPARELLIYLLSHPERRHRREALPDMIWGELRAPARGSFNTTIWRLKKFLSPLNGPVLQCDSATLRLEVPQNCSIDTLGLHDAVARLHGSGDMLEPALREALVSLVAGWRGPFADGEDTDWLLEERERMHDLYVRALMALMRDAGLRKRYEMALEYGQRILRVDPFRESVHCEMLWLMVLTGQRARAIRKHLEFRTRLAQDMNIQPMTETSALFEFIRNGMEHDRPAPGAATTLDDTLQRTRNRHTRIYTALCSGQPVPEA